MPPRSRLWLAWACRSQCAETSGESPARAAATFTTRCTWLKVTWTVIIIGRFAGAKLIEDWVELDRLGLCQQLGCIPTGS